MTEDTLCEELALHLILCIIIIVITSVGNGNGFLPLGPKRGGQLIWNQESPESPLEAPLEESSSAGASSPLSPESPLSSLEESSSAGASSPDIDSKKFAKILPPNKKLASIKKNALSFDWGRTRKFFFFSLFFSLFPPSLQAVSTLFVLTWRRRKKKAIEKEREREKKKKEERRERERRRRKGSPESYKDSAKQRAGTREKKKKKKKKKEKTDALRAESSLSPPLLPLSLSFSLSLSLSRARGCFVFEIEK